MQKLCNCIVIGFIVISEGTSWSGEPVGWENRHQGTGVVSSHTYPLLKMTRSPTDNLLQAFLRNTTLAVPLSLSTISLLPLPQAGEPSIHQPIWPLPCFSLASLSATRRILPCHRNCP